jgi:hypothetical protein
MGVFDIPFRPTTIKSRDLHGGSPLCHIPWLQEAHEVVEVGQQIDLEEAVEEGVEDFKKNQRLENQNQLWKKLFPSQVKSWMNKTRLKRIQPCLAMKVPFMMAFPVTIHR